MNRRQFLAAAAGLAGGVLLSAKKAEARPEPELLDTFQTPHHRHVLRYPWRSFADMGGKIGRVNWFPYALDGKTFEPGTALFIGFTREPIAGGEFKSRVEIAESIGVTWNRKDGRLSPECGEPYVYWDSPFERMPTVGVYRCCIGDDHGRFCEAKARFWIGKDYSDHTYACADHAEVLTRDGDTVCELGNDGRRWWCVPPAWKLNQWRRS